MGLLRQLLTEILYKIVQLLAAHLLFPHSQSVPETLASVSSPDQACACHDRSWSWKAWLATAYNMVLRMQASLLTRLSLQVNVQLAVRSGQPMARIRFRNATSAKKMGHHPLQPIAGALPIYCEWQPTNRPCQDTDDAPGTVPFSMASRPLQLSWLEGELSRQSKLGIGPL